MRSAREGVQMEKERGCSNDPWGALKRLWNETEGEVTSRVNVPEAKRREWPTMSHAADSLSKVNTEGQPSVWTL